MRTERAESQASDSPWLEYFHDQEGRTLKFELSQFPFTIGRDPAVDLPVNSNRVSRRHAEIVRTPDDRYVLRDLQSTNGTSINGQPVEEAELVDGDVIVVADSELTYFSGAVSSQVAATQVMTQHVSTSGRHALDLVVEIRRLQETLVHRAAGCKFCPVVDLATKDVYGYQAVRFINELDSPLQSVVKQLEDVECHLLDRVNQQYRLIAAEQAMQWEDSYHLFLPLQVSDVSVVSLPDDLSHLGRVMRQRHRLVVEVPETAVCDIPYFRQFVERLRDCSVEVAYAGFCGSASQVEHWNNVAPDYLELAPALVHGISRASGGWRQTQLLLDAAHKLDCEVIATGIQDDADAECLAELGCRYAMGDRYGRPEPIASWLTPAEAAVHG